MITILVCLKPIRASCLSNESVNPNEIRLNPYDIPALQSALAIKNHLQDCRVICLSMGVEQTLEVLYRCLAMGADQAILLNDTRFAASDTYATSYILSEAIKKIGSVNIVACGAKSLDGETGQVPVEIAARLNMAYLSHVEKMVMVSGGYAVIDTVSPGKWERVRTQLPLVTIFDQFRIVEPTVSLFSLKRSKHLQLVIWDANDLGVDCVQIGQGGSKTKVINVKNATRAVEAKVLEGTVDMKSTYLHNLIMGDYSVTSI